MQPPHPIGHASSSITFPVQDVERASEPLPSTDYGEALLATLSRGGAVEAYSRDTRPLVYPRPNRLNLFIHGFIAAATLAYDRHYPLTLSPDMIWLLIAQGFALHVNANAEALRRRFVTHTGKATLSLQLNAFVRGFAGNDWEGVFEEFSEQIRACVGADIHARIVQQFSTTGIVEKAAMEITLMDTLQHYFSCNVMTLCGIPAITLEGTPADWEAVRNGAAALAEYDLAWWIDALLPVLDQFVAASHGNVDRAFWESFYKLDGESGGPNISGHVLNLFPYSVLKQPQHNVPERNPYLGCRPPTRNRRGTPGGLTTNMLPPALSVAPFTWDYRGTPLPMEFVAGFVGVTQDTETLSLRPEIGWAVREKSLP